LVKNVNCRVKNRGEIFIYTINKTFPLTIYRERSHCSYVLSATVSAFVNVGVYRTY